MWRLLTVLTAFLTYSNSLFSQENHVTKSVFLFSFAKSIQWPDENKIDELRIGVIGTTENANKELRKMADRKQWKGKKINILVFSSPSAITPVEMLWAVNNGSFEIEEVTNHPDLATTVIVGDNFPPSKCMISFVIVNNRVKFTYNEEQFKKKGISAAELATLATQETNTSETFIMYKGEKINVIDPNGLKQGKWIFFSGSDSSRNRVPVSEGIYRNNEKDGIWKSYHRNGKVKSEINFINNKPQGQAIIYDDAGNLQEEGTWLNNKWIGPYKTYHPNGKIRYDWVFDNNGQRDGIQKEYYPSGRLLYYGTYKAGKPEGEQLFYSVTGNINKREFYENGELKGAPQSSALTTKKTTIPTMVDQSLTEMETVEMQYKAAIEEKDKQLKAVQSVLTKSQLEYENLRKEQQIKNLLVVNQEKELRIQRTQRLYFIAGISLAVFILALVIYAFRQNLKSTRTLAERNERIQHAYAIIEEQHKDIKSSIRYAKRIQEAILPQKQFRKVFGENGFIFYRPKDIVSGDFFWMMRTQESIYVAAVDCTGHGVPGAFMSIVGFTLLNQAVKDYGENSPADILNNIHKNLHLTLAQQSNDDLAIRDGMDIALIRLSKDFKNVEFAGANNPLYLIRNGVLSEIKGDKRAIGDYYEDNFKSYTNHKVEVMSGDSLVIFTDGYADQFGGPRGKKFKYAQLKRLLADASKKRSLEAEAMLRKSFDDWKGELHQVDDVCVVGIKIA